MEVNDIIIYGVLISFFCAFANTPNITKLLIILIISIICVYVEYDTFLKKQNIDNYNTILYLIIDYMHTIVFVSVFFLLCIAIKLKCNVNYVFILNIFALVTLLLFFHFKQCILSLWMYKIIDTKQWVQPVDRLKYMLGLDTKYNIEYRGPDNNEINNWINGQYLFITVLLLLNIYCFFKKKKC
jgi:hypothetical protein